MAGRTPKYLQIRQAILDRIRDGRWQEGERLPVRQELVETFGVTRTTLDRALRRLIDDGILKSAKRGGTVVAAPRKTPKHAAVVSRLHGSSFHTPGAVPNDLQMMFASMVLAAGEGGLRLRFFDEAEARQDLRALREYDGVIWVQPSPEDVDLVAGQLRHKTIITNRHLDGLHWVSTHHRAGMRELTGRLLDTAPADAQVFFVQSTGVSFPHRERCEGFLEACRARERFYRVIEVPAGEDGGPHLLEAPVEDGRPLVILSTSRVHFSALVHMARMRSLVWGQTLHYGDFDTYEAYNPEGLPLSTVIQDYPGMGRAAIEAVGGLERGTCEVFVPYRIETYG